MSFSSQKTVCCLFDDITNWLLILYMKAPRGHKCPQFDKSENEDNLGFDEHDSDGYIPLPLPSWPNGIKPTVKPGQGKKDFDLPGKFTKKQQLEKALTWLESFQVETFWKRQKIHSIPAAMEHNSRQKESLESHSTSSASTSKHCHQLKKDLENQSISPTPASNQVCPLIAGLESQSTSSSPSNKHCHLRKRLET